MRLRSSVLVGAMCCLLLSGLHPVAAQDADYVDVPSRTGPAFDELVAREYRALQRQGVPHGRAARVRLIETNSLEAAGLEAKGFDDPRDEARNRALSQFNADMGDAHSHRALLDLQRFRHVPCRQHSPSGC